MAQAGPERFAFDPRTGLFKFSVSAATSPAVFPGRGGALAVPELIFRAHTAILVDPWNASGPSGVDADSVESRVAQAQDPVQLSFGVAAQGYAATRDLLTTLGTLGFEPLADRFRFRQLDVGLLPEDRSGAQP